MSERTDAARQGDRQDSAPGPASAAFRCMRHGCWRCCSRVFSQLLSLSTGTAGSAVRVRNGRTMPRRRPISRHSRPRSAGRSQRGSGERLPAGARRRHSGADRRCTVPRPGGAGAGQRRGGQRRDCQSGRHRSDCRRQTSPPPRLNSKVRARRPCATIWRHSARTSCSPRGSPAPSRQSSRPTPRQNSPMRRSCRRAPTSRPHSGSSTCSTVRRRNSRPISRRRRRRSIWRRSISATPRSRHRSMAWWDSAASILASMSESAPR